MQLSTHFKPISPFFERSSEESLALSSVLHFHPYEVDQVADLAEKFM